MRRETRVGKLDSAAVGFEEVEEWEELGIMANLLRGTGVERGWSSTGRAAADGAGQLLGPLSTSVAVASLLLLIRSHAWRTGLRTVCGQRRSHIIVVRPAPAMMTG